MGWRPSREVRGHIAIAVLLFVVLEALLAAAVIWWPTFRENADALQALAGPIPKLADDLRLMLQERAGVSAYVVGQHFFKGCNTLGSAAAVLIAMGAVAGEAHRGTLELWLSRPVPRWRLYTERYVRGQLAMWIPVLLSTATTNVLLERVDDSMDLGSLMVCAVHECTFLGAIYSVTFMISAMGSQPLRIAFGVLFFTIFQFAIYMVKTISEYSMYRLVDIETYVTMLRYGLEPGPTTILVIANVLPFCIGLAVFQRRVP